MSTEDETTQAKKIKVCHCGSPAVSTFMFIGAEWYCPSCGANGGMFGFGENVDATPELLAQAKKITKEFNGYSIHIWKTSGGMKVDCKKCVGGERHAMHLTKEESKKQDIACEGLLGMHNG